MKKNLFGWLAMAAMLVGTGCSSDEVVNDYSSENAIQFGTYVGRDAQGRVAETTIDVMKKNDFGFGVFANYTKADVALTPNFMNNQMVKWNSNSSAWEYSPVKYWPNNTSDKVTFWAYGPYNDENTATDATAPCFAIHDGTDYVAAAPITSSKLEVNDVDDKIKFNFSHMMSKVGFKVETIIDELEHVASDNGIADDESADAANNAIDSKTTVVVTKVTLAGALIQGGTYTYSNTTGDWALSTTSTSEVTSHVLINTNFANAEDVLNSVINGQKATTTVTELNNADSYLMLVPQSTGINITVEYSVITEDENLAIGYSQVNNVIKSSDFNFTFERGKAYNFVLHLGLTSVKFDAEVGEWEDATDKVVNVPLNIKDND